MKLLNALPRQPFIGLAVAASIGILLADFAPNHSLAMVIALAFLAITALLSRKSFPVYALVAAGFIVLHSLRTSDSPAAELAVELGEEPRPVTVRGSVVTEPKFAPSGTASFLLQSESIEIDGVTRRSRVRFLARWRSRVELGDEVSLFGTAEPVGLPRNPGEFDFRSYLARQDVQRILLVRYPENGLVLHHAGGNLIRHAAQKSREWMQVVLSRDLEKAPDVTGAINGMVLGLRRQTPEDIEEPFQQTGTLHLFAVAGLHVGIVARLLWILGTVARLPRNWTTVLIIPALLFYAAVTGLHTSSVRAAVMSAVLLAGFFAERKVLSLNSLAAAAMLILCWNTNELFSIGFQLSFSVVTAIILLADPTYRFLRNRFEPDPFLPRRLFGARRRILGHATSWLARASSVSFAAWLGSLPLMLGYYYLVTPVSLLANLIVVPIAFFVLAAGLISMVVAPISTWLSVVFNNTNWLLTKTILGAVQLFAQIPGGHLHVEHPHWPSGASIEINVLDLKSGGAMHVRTTKSDWLFDTGSFRNYDRVVRQYLRSRGVNRLDGLVLTQGDAGHIGGASSALLDFSPPQLLDTATPDRSPIHRRLIADLARSRRPRRLSTAGDEFDLSPDVKAKVLFPPSLVDSGRADDQALVIQLALFGRSRVLIMSDSGVPTEEFLLKHCSNLRSDILIKGQHHSGVSGSDAFLDSVRPQAIIATSRDFPKNEQIMDEWVEGLGARGIKLFRQDETGAVQIRIFRDRWEAKTYLSSETFRSTKQ